MPCTPLSAYIQGGVLSAGTRGAQPQAKARPSRQPHGDRRADRSIVAGRGVASPSEDETEPTAARPAMTGRGSGIVGDPKQAKARQAKSCPSGSLYSAGDRAAQVGAWSSCMEAAPSEGEAEPTAARPARGFRRSPPATTPARRRPAIPQPRWSESRPGARRYKNWCPPLPAARR
jgi:hypothetical protein